MIEIDGKNITHQVWLLNDDKVSGDLVFSSMQLYFLTLLDEQKIVTIMKSAEKNGRWPLMMSTEKECKRACEYFKALGVPVEFEKITYV